MADEAAWVADLDFAFGDETGDPIQGLLNPGRAVGEDELGSAVEPDGGELIGQGFDVLLSAFGALWWWCFMVVVVILFWF